ncbi:MAG: ribbon-helix-helix protein, CopG family [Desulfurococcales archaeon]|nr:ribbon-helix-helix protein, CopG family [Desulfurococcales archaeon]
MPQASVRVVTFKIDPRTLEALDRLAATLRMTRSELIREAIERLLDDYGVEVERPLREAQLREDLVTIEITL